jgi:hypothetical protein
MDSESLQPTIRCIAESVFGEDNRQVYECLYDIQNSELANKGLFPRFIEGQEFTNVLTSFRDSDRDVEQNLKMVFGHGEPKKYRAGHMKILVNVFVRRYGVFRPGHESKPESPGGQVSLKPEESDTTLLLREATVKRYKAHVKLEEMNEKYGAIHVEHDTKTREQNSCQTALDVAKQAMQARQQALDKATHDCDESKKVYDKVRGEKRECQTAWNRADQEWDDASEKQRQTFLEQSIPGFGAKSAAKRQKRDA